MRLKSFKQLNEIGSSKQLTGLQRFVDDFIENVNNPIIMSMLHRMLDSEKFIKDNITVYSLSDEDIQKLQEIKPLLDSLVQNVSDLKTSTR